MNTTILTLATAGAILGTVDGYAQFSAPFGTWTAAPETAYPLSLDTSGNPPNLFVSATFGISGTLTPNLGTPGGLTTYNVKYENIQLSLSSDNSVIDGLEPVVLEFGPITFSVEVNVPGGGGPFAPIAIPAVTPVTQVKTLNLLATGNLEDFTVEWSFLSAPVEAGGKGVSFNITPSLNGQIAVPEPGHFALLAGLGLVGFAGCRRAKR